MLGVIASELDGKPAEGAKALGYKHLITFFARTPIVKEFRKWVRDVLEKEVLQQQIDACAKLNSEQQAGLLKEIVRPRL